MVQSTKRLVQCDASYTPENEIVKKICTRNSTKENEHTKVVHVVTVCSYLFLGERLCASWIAYLANFVVTALAPSRIIDASLRIAITRSSLSYPTEPNSLSNYLLTYHLLFIATKRKGSSARSPPQKRLFETPVGLTVAGFRHAATSEEPRRG